MICLAVWCHTRGNFCICPGVYGITTKMFFTYEHAWHVPVITVIVTYKHRNVYGTFLELTVLCKFLAEPRALAIQRLAAYSSYAFYRVPHRLFEGVITWRRIFCRCVRPCICYVRHTHCRTCNISGG
jgi:hypothetical protein